MELNRLNKEQLFSLFADKDGILNSLVLEAKYISEFIKGKTIVAGEEIGNPCFEGYLFYLEDDERAYYLDITYINDEYNYLEATYSIIKKSDIDWEELGIHESKKSKRSNRIERSCKA